MSCTPPILFGDTKRVHLFNVIDFAGHKTICGGTPNRLGSGQIASELVRKMVKILPNRRELGPLRCLSGLAGPRSICPDLSSICPAGAGSAALRGLRPLRYASPAPAGQIASRSGQIARGPGFARPNSLGPCTLCGRRSP